MEIGIIGVKLVESEQPRRIDDVLNEQAGGAEHWIKLCSLFMCEDHLERRRVPWGERMI